MPPILRQSPSSRSTAQPATNSAPSTATPGAATNANLKPHSNLHSIAALNAAPKVVLLPGCPTPTIAAMSMRRLFLLPALLLAVSLPSVAATPGVGQRAPDFTLTALDGTSVSLSSYTSQGRVVLILLRGCPGYQCPFSQQQFQSYQQAAAQFATLGTQVIFIYPGASSKSLADDAAQLLGGQSLPANMHLLLDPDYVF